MFLALALALAAATAAAADDGAALEVVVEGASEGEALEQSAEAVRVIDTQRAQWETADLGEVIARAEGVSVRRSGGLGSDTRFALNGLTDDQIRFFLDGVPLELTGFPFGIANVPVDFVDRVEVFRGVVPTRFGADALGGAVNLVGDDGVDGTHGSASLQVGAFSTTRATLGFRHQHAPTGLFVRAGGFFDQSENDYPIDVEVPSQDPETRGRLVPATVRRFHDGYRAGGGLVELGLVERRWADRLLLRAFGTDFARDIQSNPTMQVPYGDVRSQERSAGGSLRYAHTLRDGSSVDAVAGATRSHTDFVDTGTCIYDWFGDCVRERPAPGEIQQGQPTDRTLHEDALFARVHGSWAVTGDHALRVSVAPTLIARHGEDHLNDGSTYLSPITAHRQLLTFVAGAEHQVDLLGGRLQNIAFGKRYLQVASSDEPVVGTITRALERRTQRWGAGDGLRLRLLDGDDVYVKLSYEYATRLPRADEVFGDAMLVNENLELQPEVSHNVNVELSADEVPTAVGSFRGTVNGFLRETDDLILLLAAYGERFRHENVFAARSTGVEAAAGWTSRRSWLRLDANTTWVDFRNRTDEGPFAPFQGDRIPNRPYVFANGSARLQATDLLFDGDLASLSWHTRYVHAFTQFWESAGTDPSKSVIPSQLTHAVALTVALTGGPRRLTLTGEVDNLTDARVYDFFGAQRPGRAWSFKSTAEF